MSVVPRNENYKGTPIHFRFNDNPDFGMVNLSYGWVNEALKLTNVMDKVIDHEKINIHIPIFDNHYVKTVKFEGGYTLLHLISLIIMLGTEAGEYDAQKHPEHYHGPAKANDFIREHAITSSPKFSDINIDGEDVYVEFQH